MQLQILFYGGLNKGITDLIPEAVEAVKNETIEKMELFSSIDRASLLL